MLVSLGGASWLPISSSHDPNPIRQVRDVFVPALRTQLIEGSLQSPEVISVQATRPFAAEDVLGELLRVLGTDELLVVGGPDVDQRLDGAAQEGPRVVGGAGCWVEGRIVYRVPVDLSDVEVLLDLGDAVGLDAVGYAPDLVGRRVVVVGQLLPVFSRDESDDAAWVLGGATVVFAIFEVRFPFVSCGRGWRLRGREEERGWKKRNGG